MFRQIDSGVKKVDTSGRSTTMRSTQPVPTRDDRGAAEIAVRDGLLEQRAQQVVDIGGARHKAAVHEELRGRLERHAPPRALRVRSRGYAGRDAGDGSAAGSAAKPETHRRSCSARMIGRMIVALDVGNTNIKYSIVDDAEAAASRPRPDAAAMTRWPRWAAWLAGAARPRHRWRAPPSIELAMVSVVPAVDRCHR